MAPVFLHVINSLAPGGAEKQLLGFVRRSSLENEILELGESDAFRVLRRLRAELQARAPTAVMAWLERPQIAVAATAPRRLPLVANVCGLPRRTSWRRLALVAALARYDGLVTNSAAARDAMRAYARPLRLAPFRIVPNGVEEGVARILRRRIDGPLRVGFIGRADETKGVDVLARALAEFARGEVEATLVGRGVPDALAGLRSPAIAAVHEGVADPWTTVGDIDVLVVPSRSEGSPNVVIEAFVRGVPVIATRAGGSVELLEERRGLLVPVDDPHALADALRSLPESWPQALEGAERAREYALRVHAWPRVVAGYEDVLLAAARR